MKDVEAVAEGWRRGVGWGAGTARLLVKHREKRDGFRAPFSDARSSDLPAGNECFVDRDGLFSGTAILGGLRLRCLAMTELPARARIPRIAWTAKEDRSERLGNDEQYGKFGISPDFPAHAACRQHPNRPKSPLSALTLFQPRQGRLGP